MESGEGDKEVGEEGGEWGGEMRVRAIEIACVCCNSDMTATVKLMNVRP